MFLCTQANKCLGSYQAHLVKYIAQIHNNIQVLTLLEVLLHFPCKIIHYRRPGPSCSKLTTSLVNDSLKFKSCDTQIC